MNQFQLCMLKKWLYTKWMLPFSQFLCIASFLLMIDKTPCWNCWTLTIGWMQQQQQQLNTIQYTYKTVQNLCNIVNVLYCWMKINFARELVCLKVISCILSFKNRGWVKFLVMLFIWLLWKLSRLELESTIWLRNIPWNIVIDAFVFAYMPFKCIYSLKRIEHCAFRFNAVEIILWNQLWHAPTKTQIHAHKHPCHFSIRHISGKRDKTNLMKSACVLYAPRTVFVFSETL